jgi:hypothetical protein
MKKIIGEKLMNIYTEKLDSIKVAKIDEFCQKATVKCSAQSGGAKVPIKRPTSAPKKVKLGIC